MNYIKRYESFEQNYLKSAVVVQGNINKFSYSKLIILITNFLNQHNIKYDEEVLNAPNASILLIYNSFGIIDDSILIRKEGEKSAVAYSYNTTHNNKLKTIEIENIFQLFDLMKERLKINEGYENNLFNTVLHNKKLKDFTPTKFIELMGIFSKALNDENVYKYENTTLVGDSRGYFFVIYITYNQSNISINLTYNKSNELRDIYVKIRNMEDRVYKRVKYPISLGILLFFRNLKKHINEYIKPVNEQSSYEENFFNKVNIDKVTLQNKGVDFILNGLKLLTKEYYTKVSNIKDGVYFFVSNKKSKKNHVIFRVNDYGGDVSISVIKKHEIDGYKTIFILDGNFNFIDFKNIIMGVIENEIS